MRGATAQRDYQAAVQKAIRLSGLFTNKENIRPWGQWYRLQPTGSRTVPYLNMHTLIYSTTACTLKFRYIVFSALLNY